LIQQWESSGVGNEKGWYGEKQQPREKENVDVRIAVKDERGRGSLRGIKRGRERSVEPRVCVVR